MFTVERRREVRAALLGRARDDSLISAAATTGSAASGAEDRWSDIDLFFGVAPGNTVDSVVEEWSDFVYRRLGALHHFDLRSGAATYRAFLLDDCLEVDLGFTPAAEFGPLGNGEFEVVFGEAARRRASAPPDAAHVVGLAWHHVLHARTSIERGRPWQAEHWISALRDHVLTLACLRLGLPSAYAKGADALPAEIGGAVREALVRGLDVAELSRALLAATNALVSELDLTDPQTAATLRGPLMALASV